MPCRRTSILFILALTANATVLAGAKPLPGNAPNAPATILMDGRMLAESRHRIQTGDAELLPAYSALLAEAEMVMTQQLFSVTDKTITPPSGDTHDYASYARYWWPDPSKPDGLPYICRDGQTNPESQSPEKSDRWRLNMMAGGVETLGLAYFMTGEERYANKAAELLQTWFIHPASCMNPHLKHSQVVPGISLGSRYGLIDGRLLCRAMDGAVLISDSPAFGTTGLEAMREWAARYLDWLKTSKNAQAAALEKNNHSTFCDAQTMYFALFVGDTEFARGIAEGTIDKRILAQIAPDGSQPEELHRTRSLHYSVFNLEALFALARMAEQVDVDLWHAADSRMKAAIDFLAPYADPEQVWPHREIKETNRIALLPLLLHAADAYEDGAYKKQAEKLPEEERKTRREYLAGPLMR